MGEPETKKVCIGNGNLKTVLPWKRGSYSCGDSGWLRMIDGYTRETS